jgi:1-phosphatidylinositol-3-phosphate 5-kinase
LRAVEGAGGRSRSNFWKTSDDRFIIKTLVNVWNIADLYVVSSFLFFFFSLTVDCVLQYNQKPMKTFDLKVIQGSKVNSAASKTLFDSKWIEGQQRALTLVNPVSKAILREATRADCVIVIFS